jgi:cell division protein FtsI (penicillin-binding protein 3)
MVVIMDPRTGHILALANYPDFDPNSLKGTPLSSLRNLAVERYFEPGSTFKIVTASAALEEGLTAPEEIIYCGNGFISISGHIIRDHKPFQNLSFNEVIANSSDVGAIKLGLRLGEAMFHRYICAFGFGERTAIDLPAEEAGYIRKPSNWSGISIGAVSMGQEVGVTGVQMLRAMGAIANGGYLVRPMVVDRILDENGRLVQRFDPEKIRIISGRTAEILRNALVLTVGQGTARKAGVPGYAIAGKTGTAQKFDFETRSYSKTDFVASFIGFAPADRPQFVAAVVFDSPRPLYHGGDVSAPVFAEIARNIFLQKKIQPSTPTPELAAGSPSIAPPAEPPAAALTLAGDSLLAMDSGQRETVMSLIPEGSFTMPDFTGKSLRAVIKECARIGLVLQPSGSGVAVEQIPPAGALIKPASRCTVWFSSDIQRISTFLRSGDSAGPEAAKNILSRNASQ